MGSIIMDPADIPTIAANLGMSKTENISTICTSVGKVTSHGMFSPQANPLGYWVPLLLLQMSLCTGTFLFVTALFSSVGLPMVVRQLLGGIILGPSLLCRSQFLANLIFPIRGFVMLDTAASFGFILYFFLIGVQMDPSLFKNLDRKTISIGVCCVAVPVLITTGTSIFILSTINLDENIAKSLPNVAQAESVIAFPIIAGFLAELKIINSDFGRLALSASFVAGLCSSGVVIFTVLWQTTPEKNHFTGLQCLFNIAIILIIIIFIMRPILLWIIKQNPEGQPLKQSHVLSLIVSALFTGFLSKTLGLNLYIGPLVFGISMPAGPPVGSTIVERLDLLTNWLFMPLYLVKNGLVINITTIKLKNYLILQTVALIGAIGKFSGTYIVSRWSNIPTRDAASLGLVMNAQGVLELGMFKLLRREMLIDNESFVIMSISIMIVTGTIAPIIKLLYDPSKRYAVYKRRSMMNLRPNLELRVLVCVHEDENVPALMNVLEALNPTKRSPLVVYVLHLIELVGRSNALLIPHMLTKMSSKETKNSNQIVKAFKSFEQNNFGFVSVFPYTAISPSKTMHDDVCSMALDKRTSLVIVPFHKRLQPNGMIQSYKSAIKITNINVLDKAPCSTAVLVDHSFLSAPRPIFNSQSCYRVALLFLGGSDDREALALGARMAGHNCVKLTLIRLLENGSISSNEESDKKIDNEVLSEFRTAMSGNYRVMYIEEVVMDGTGTISVIKSMEDQYELVIVGRQHDYQSRLLSGLLEWHDHKELGTIGDLCSSAMLMSKTKILVVQQHVNPLYEGSSEGSTITNSTTSTEDGEAELKPLYRAPL